MNSPGLKAPGVVEAGQRGGAECAPATAGIDPDSAAAYVAAARARRNFLLPRGKDHPDGTRVTPRRLAQERTARDRLTVEAANDGITWLSLLRLDSAIAARTLDEERLAERLADVAATAMDWIDAIARRKARRG